MPKSFMSYVTKAVTSWKTRSSNSDGDKIDTTQLNYLDAVSTPDLNSSRQMGKEKTALVKHSIRDEMYVFFTETSFTALTQIYKANSVWKRLVWIVLVIGMFAWLVVQCYWLLDKYYRYPIEVKLDLKVVTVLEFPSVTICNLNPILESKVSEEPYTLLQKYVKPDVNDTLYKETIKTWKFEENCDTDEFVCNNGLCLVLLSICDGWLDCWDGEDEDYQLCKNHTCPETTWKCTNPPKCLSMWLRCDGTPGDCNKTLDEDEVNCENNTCPEEYFRCTSGMCIPSSYVCDDDEDCENDEFNCTDYTCEPERVKCNSTQKCILRRWLCDDYNDCPDGEDEWSCPSFSVTEGYNVSNTEIVTSTISTLTTAISTASRETTTDLFTTGENSRIKRDIHYEVLRKDAENKTKQSRDKLHKYKETLASSHPYPGKHGDNFRSLRTSSDVARNNESREDFINELYESYLSYQKSVIMRNGKTQGAGDVEITDNKEVHHRVKRSSRPQQSVKNSSSININWDTVLQNSTFNKWKALESGAISMSFYDERDDEYEAAMTYAYITAKLDPSFVEKSGHDKIDLIAACRFGGYQCSPANFTYFHSHKYGNCYTFNSKFANNTALTTRFPGPENGLRLELFLDQKHYVANLATEAGVRVLVHKKGSMPFPEDEGISILSGHSTSVGIKQVTYSRLPPPHGVCGDFGETPDYYRANLGTDYSKLSCLKSCYQDLIVKYCKCVVPLYYVLDNVTVCNMTDRDTEYCVTTLPNTYTASYEKCDMMCPVPCEETKYDMSISTAKWPSEKYLTYLKQRLGQTNAKYQQAEDCDSEFTKLQIYYQDLFYEHVEQQRGYESMNLISDLGGQLGLWLGLSAITIGEICSFLFGVGRLIPIKFWGNKTTPIQDDLTPVGTIKPATFEEMFEDICPEAAKYTPPDLKSPKSRSTFA